MFHYFRKAPEGLDMMANWPSLTDSVVAHRRPSRHAFDAAGAHRRNDGSARSPHDNIPSARVLDIPRCPIRICLALTGGEC